MKRRKLGAGAKRSLDTDDEEFIARSLEETSTAHGRRHDRVKKRHFLSLANYNLQCRGKRLIKSSTTVLKDRLQWHLRMHQFSMLCLLPAPTYNNILPSLLVLHHN